MNLKLFSLLFIFLAPHIGSPKLHREVEHPIDWHQAAAKSDDGTIRALVILAEYQDVPFTYTRERFDSLLNFSGYSTNGATGCVKDYFNSQFCGKVNFEFTVSDIVTVSKPRSYYGTNSSSTGYDTHAGTFIAEACTLADEKIDFSLFDNDGNGYVDNVFVFFAGEDEAQQDEGKNADYMWSHSYSLSGTQSDYKSKAPLVLDGVKLDQYACSSELYRRYTTDVRYDTHMAGIGTFCHEFSHILGLVDYYDTDYEKSGGTAAGLWRTTSLMDAGNYNNYCNTPANYNAIDLNILGLMQMDELSIGANTLHPIGTSSRNAFCITNPADSAEMYVLECRSQKGWDRYIGGCGMLVYHIDMSEERKSESDDYGQITSLSRWTMYNQVNCRPDLQCADLVEADGRSDKNPSSVAYSNIEGVFFPQSGSSAIGSAYTVKLPFWDGTASPLDITEIRFSGDNVELNVCKAGEVDPTEPTDPPTDEDPLYIVTYAGLDSLSAVIPYGTVLQMRVNNSVGSKSVSWYFDSQEIDPQSFEATGSGEIRAVIDWGESIDYLVRKITVGGGQK